MASRPDATAAIVAGLTALYARWAAGTTIGAMRDDWDAFVSPPSASTPLPIDDVTIGSRSARWFGGTPSGADRVILQLHGGGYQVGSSRSHRALCTALHRAHGAKVLCIDYRLAPEHRFPAALDDTIAGWDHLVASGIAASRIAVCGDSAGGALALGLATTLRAAGRAGPVALALMSPWVDLSLTASSLTANAARDPVTSRAVLALMARAYLGRSGDVRDPRVSPIGADLTGLPPLLVQVGADEALLDDAAGLVERATLHGVDARLEVWPAMFHVFQLFAGRLSEADAAVRTAADFLDRHFATPSAASAAATSTAST